MCKLAKPTVVACLHCPCVCTQAGVAAVRPLPAFATPVRLACDVKSARSSPGIPIAAVPSRCGRCLWSRRVRPRYEPRSARFVERGSWRRSCGCVSGQTQHASKIHCVFFRARATCASGTAVPALSLLSTHNLDRSRGCYASEGPEGIASIRCNDGCRLRRSDGHLRFVARDGAHSCGAQARARGPAIQLQRRQGSRRQHFSHGQRTGRPCTVVHVAYLAARGTSTERLARARWVTSGRVDNCSLCCTSVPQVCSSRRCYCSLQSRYRVRA